MYVLATLIIGGLGAAALLGGAYLIEYAYEHDQNIKDIIDRIS